MNKSAASRSRPSAINMLIMGSMALGIVCICWALVHIKEQAVATPAYASIVPSSTPILPVIQEYGFLTKTGIQSKTSSRPTSSSPTPAPSAAVNEIKILYPVRPAVGDEIGTLSIPALNQVIPIVHGADEEQLKQGIGHFAQSVLPGENDNSVLSGHRDTVFRQLGELELGDQLIATTSAGTFTYEIKETKIVHKDDLSVIVPTDHAVLTVTTCYPFRYVGDAPDRYIITAELVKSE